MEYPVLIHFDAIQKQTVLTFEDGSMEQVNQSPVSYLEHLCIRNCSTLQGRQDAFRLLTGYHAKAPVLISEQLDYLYFPTVSQEKNDCVWVDESRIIKCKKVDAWHTTIFFTSGFRKDLEVNVRVIRNQLNRCEELRRKLYEK